MSGELELKVQQRSAPDAPAHIFLNLTGHATPANHAVLTKAFQKVRDDLAATHEKNGGVILVLRELEAFSSSCVGAMLGLSRDLQKTGRRIVLAEVPSAVLQILDLLRLGDVFPIFASEAEAHTGLRADP
ncbi:MAG: STAS domain-containing protein [Leptospirales bacterium]